MRPQLFVVPPAHAAPSGGNLYNEGLLAALHALTTPDSFSRASVEDLERLELGAFAAVWLDSLYLARAPLLRARLARGTRLYLLAHAFPSDLARASEQPAAELLVREHGWLGAFDAALVPSRTMAQGVAQRAPTLPCHVVAPAVHAQPPARSAELSLPRVAIIANLVPNKGVLPFLHALEQALVLPDRFDLRIVGGFEANPDYARACSTKLGALHARAAAGREALPRRARRAGAGARAGVGVAQRVLRSGGGGRACFGLRRVGARRRARGPAGVGRGGRRAVCGRLYPGGRAARAVP
jgi:hypothetical protein